MQALVVHEPVDHLVEYALGVLLRHHHLPLAPIRDEVELLAALLWAPDIGVFVLQVGVVDHHAHIRAFLPVVPVLLELLETSFEDVRRDGFGEKPLYESWLAETEGNPAGVATFFMTYSTFKGRPCLHLDNLYVNEGARRFGIAQKLIHRLCRRAVELNCWRMDLHVEKDNQARAFYEKIGLSETSDRVYAVWDKNLKVLAQKDSGTILSKKLK